MNAETLEPEVEVVPDNLIKAMSKMMRPSDDSDAVRVVPKPEEPEEVKATRILLADQQKRTNQAHVEFNAMCKRLRIGWRFDQQFSNGQQVKANLVFVAQ